MLIWSTTSRFYIAIAALFGATAVMLGAYASHGMSTWASPAQISQVQLAAQYQLFHAISLVFVALLSVVYCHRLLSAALVCFSLGIVCFSGSLYYLALLGSKTLVLVTPLGGLLLICAWLLVAVAMLCKPK
jgi:uncharacterized membrane protein YgdD (TMEM256/DUF423 family)